MQLMAGSSADVIDSLAPEMYIKIKRQKFSDALDC